MTWWKFCVHALRKAQGLSDKSRPLRQMVRVRIEWTMVRMEEVQRKLQEAAVEGTVTSLLILLQEDKLCS